MKTSLKEKRAGNLTKKRARETNRRLADLENTQENKIHTGFPENPKHGDLAWYDGALYKRNSDNTAWEQVGGVTAATGLVIYQAASVSALGTPTAPAFGYITTAGSEAGLWWFPPGSTLNSQWEPFPAWTS